MYKANLKLFLLLFSQFLFVVSISFAQSDLSLIDYESPSKIDCYILDSVLSSSHDFKSEQQIKYFEVLAEYLPEYDNYRLGLFYLDSLIVIYTANNNEALLASKYSNKSMIHDHLGQYPEALSASQKALSVYKKINDKAGVAYSYNDIGVIHYYRGDDSLARHYLNLSGDIYKSLQDTAGMAIFANNLGNVYFEIEDAATALKMYKKGLQYDEYLNNPEGQAVSLCNIGESYTHLENYDKAEESLLLALSIAEELNDTWTITVPLMALGDLYIRTKNYSKAKKVLNRSLKLTTQIHALAEQAQTIKLLYQINKEQKDFNRALYYLEQLRTIEDSIFNQNSESNLKEMEMQYQVNDKQKEIELLNKESKIQRLTHKQNIKEEQAQQKILLFSIIGIALFLVIMIGGFILKKKANNQLQEQNKLILKTNTDLNTAYDEIEEKNNEILDSIRYAKRIQSAILPAKNKIAELLPDSFVLYLPKDVVAGDFYWLEKVEDKILFASADCTGHGVPGAMVSVVCNNALNRSVREYGLTDPGEILDKTRNIVLQEFEKSEDQVNDGMDIAICCLAGNKLTYAGANNPLWIIKKDSTDITEIKANKQPIGKFDNPKPYNTHTVLLDPGDTIYLSTDGYADQFGGDKGKKLKTANFKKLLLSVSNRSLPEQHSRLNDAFEEWKDEIEQIDDVCIIGVKYGTLK